MRTRIWMTPWESVGKAIVVLLAAVVFALLVPLGQGDVTIPQPLAILALTAILGGCFLVYELVGRTLGMLGERLFAGSSSGRRTEPHGERVHESDL